VNLKTGLAVLLMGLPVDLCLGQREMPWNPIVERDGKRYLWGGPDQSQHFDVTQFRLDASRLHYGLGRENFPALIAPEFVSAREADQWLGEDDPVLGVQIGAEAKAYPISLLVRHEVVNDTVGGKPVFAAYCVLAKLGAIYDRQLGNHTYTFAVSGYTYADPGIWGGRDAFVLWDRDTESLWLPTIGKAVSGPMIDVPMKLLPKDRWEQTTWGKFKRERPNALVLKPGQTMRPPPSWQHYDGPFPEKKNVGPAESIAPRMTRNGNHKPQRYRGLS
jgi:hypothetical protein